MNPVLHLRRLASNPRLRSLWWLFWAITLPSALLIGYRTWPRSQRLDWRLYESQGSLLLPRSDQHLLNRILGQVHQSELERWLGNPLTFHHLIQSHKVHDKVARRLAPYPGLQAYARSVALVPIQGAQIPTLDLDPKQMERDYAQLQQADSEERYQNLRIGRIWVRAMAPTAEGSQLLVGTTLDVLQSVFQEVPLSKIRREKATIQQYLKLTQKRIERAESQLQRLAQAPPPEPDELSGLRSRCGELQSQLANLSLELQHARPEELYLEAPRELQDRLDERRQALVAAERLYAPDSLHLELVRQRYKAAETTLNFHLEQQLQQRRQQLQARIQTSQKLLDQYSQELSQLEKRIPGPQRTQALESAEDELRKWELELNSWQQRLHQCRIREHLARSEGVALRLQEPLPGQRQWLPPQAQRQAYRKLNQYLPLAPFAGLVVCFVVALWKESQQVSYRAESYCDARVLVEFPDLPAQQRRQWSRAKFRGPQA